MRILLMGEAGEQSAAFLAALRSAPFHIHHAAPDDDVDGSAYDALVLLDPAQGGFVPVGPLRVDPIGRRLLRDGVPIRLSSLEYALLMCLVRAKGRAVSRAELLAEVWGYRHDPGTNLVAVLVSRLRRRIGCTAERPVIAADGGGYRLVEGLSPL
jgi:DNA-binding response OmpR family regulator